MDVGQQGVRAFASRTGTKRNLRALAAAGWHLLVSAAGVWRTEGFEWAGDNGAWADFQAERPFDEPRFERFLRWAAKQQPRPSFIVLPDIVLGGKPSLDLSVRWLRKLRRRIAWRGQRFMIAVQNGMESGAMLGRIKRMIGPLVGIFVGGDTKWKLATMAFWCRLAHAAGAICHIARVNTAKRIHLCEAAGADSIDGSSASRFEVTLRPLELARQQMDIEGYLARSAA
jgi:hypothetical protein